MKETSTYLLFFLIFACLYLHIYFLIFKKKVCVWWSNCLTGLTRNIKSSHDLQTAQSTYVKVVEGVCQLSASRWLAEHRVFGRSGLCCVGDARHRVLQLLVDQVTVNFIGCQVGVLQAGAGGRVQHGDVPLKHAASCGHLVFVMDIFKLLTKYSERRAHRKGCVRKQFHWRVKHCRGDG